MTADRPEGLHRTPLLKAVVWANFWLGLLSSLWFEREALLRDAPGSLWFALLYAAVSLAVVVWFLRGRRWARTAYVAFMWIALAALAAGSVPAGAPMAFSVVSLAVDVWLMWLVFTAPLGVLFPAQPLVPPAFAEKIFVRALAFVFVALSALILYGTGELWTRVLASVPLLALGVSMLAAARRPGQSAASG
jgi:hypothetical protein